MTAWGWVKPLLGFFSKFLGAVLLIKHGKQKAEKEQLEEMNDILKDNAKIDSARLSDDELERMR